MRNRKHRAGRYPFKALLVVVFAVVHVHETVPDPSKLLRKRSVTGPNRNTVPTERYREILYGVQGQPRINNVL